MNEPSYRTTITVDATPAEAFAAINDVRGWWTPDITGRTDTVGAEFTFRGGDVHRSRIRVTELVAGQRVAWHVLDTTMTFIQDQSEWQDTRVVFDIAPTGDGTEIRFSHVGLVPAQECYDVCSNAWAFFVNDSLRRLITTGQGRPMLKERATQGSASQ